MRTFLFKQILIGAVLLACISLAGAATHSEAEYLGGSAKVIPANTSGTLDLNDPIDLVFHYGRNLYRLPFGSISSYEFSHGGSTARRVFAHVRVPGIPWKQDQVLNLSYRGSQGEVGVLSFKLTGKDRVLAEWALRSRIDEPREASANRSSSRQRLKSA